MAAGRGAVGYDRPVMTRFFAHLSLLLATALLASAGPVAAGNYSIPPGEAERRFATGSFEIMEAKRTASGVAGAQKWKLRFDDGKVVKAKWKEAPRYLTDGWNNSPWREIAAYELQKLFLEEGDYVVPPSELRCIPLTLYRTIDSDARPTLKGTDCVYGVLSLWLQDVEEPAEVWQPDRFEQGGYYRRSIAAVDILTLLIAHKDGRPANFLWSNDDRRQVFSIDNGVSFHAFPSNPLVRNWNDMRVSALPRDMVDRLDRLSQRRLDGLAILRNLESDAAGILRPVKTTTNLDPEKSARVRGKQIQVGLSKRDLREVGERIGHLLRRVETGEIQTF